MKEKLKTFYETHKDNKILAFIDTFLYRIIRHNVFPTGGQLAYFLVLSIFPFLIALLNVVNFTPLVQTDVIEGLMEYLPEATRPIITSFLGEISMASSLKLLIISVLGGLWSASSGIRQLIRAINSAFHSRETRSYFKLTGMALVFTLALIILILLLLLTQIFGGIIVELLDKYLKLDPIILKALKNFNLYIPVIYMVLTFMLLYRFSPNIHEHKMKPMHVLPGAVFSTGGIIISSKIFTFYVDNFGKFSVTYGSLTGIILLFLWLYLMSIIIVLGGEITAIVYEKDHPLKDHRRSFFEELFV